MLQVKCKGHLQLFQFLQLLALTIQLEKPELEVKKTELLHKEEELKVQLAELEESLLEVTPLQTLFTIKLNSNPNRCLNF